ncbi:MAG: hypothetical protein PHP92_05005 [Candidatus Nanoarchaeia archaeon]|nr:hypothetical protein [Candidatus Nanoarchaeia archaeon]
MGNGIIRISEILLLEEFLMLKEFKIIGAEFKDGQVLISVENNNILMNNANIIPVYTKNELGIVNLSDIKIDNEYISNMIKCIICDKFFVKDRIYKSNHYLCGSACHLIYSELIKEYFDKDNERFVIDKDKLNEVRNKIGLISLSDDEINKRID